MSEQIVILGAVRTPIGVFGGALAGHRPTQLATLVCGAAIARSGLDPADIGQTVMGHVLHTEPRDVYVARVAAIESGVPDTSPALTVNRLCGSGLQAVVSASEAIALGHCDAALAGGVESMSRAGHLLPAIRAGARMGDTVAVDMMTGALQDPFGHGHMGVTAENIAVRDGISRAEQDAFALESHRRAAQAQAEGRFDSQILPIEVKKGRETRRFDRDEMVRTNLEAGELQRLRPVFKSGGTVTAGNASGINDGAAALVLARETLARARGLAPLARIVATGLAGVAPDLMGLGPIPASRQALTRAGLTVDDLDVIESNEAFAAQACAVSQALGCDPQRVNPNGGAIALGHPIGASGAIILTKLVHELIRTGGRYGLATMCIGGGQGIAVVIENLRPGA